MARNQENTAGYEFETVLLQSERTSQDIEMKSSVTDFEVFEHLENGFKAFLSENLEVPKSEYYIPTIVTELITKDIADFKVLESKDQWFGVTYQEDRPMVVKSINELIEAGKYPNNIWA